MIDFPLDKNPYYQSQDWLNLAGDHRESLGLPYDMINECIIAPPVQHDYKTHPKIVDERWKRIRLVTLTGITDFDNLNSARKYIGISRSLLHRWIQRGGRIIGKRGRKETAWPDWLLCFRFIDKE